MTILKSVLSKSYDTRYESAYRDKKYVYRLEYCICTEIVGYGMRIVQYTVYPDTNWNRTIYFTS